MRLTLTRPTRPSPTAEGTDPREAAIEWLREKHADGKAELHQDEPSDLLVIVGPNETRWANIAVNLCGVVLDRATLPGGGECLRLVPEADVRMSLGLDSKPADAATLGMDAVLAALPPAPRASLALLEAAQRRHHRDEDEPVSIQARRDAKAAYDARYPHGVEPQLAIRTDNEAS